MTTYADELAAIRARGYPGALVALHVKTGLSEDQVCGDCRHLAVYWSTGADGQPRFSWHCVRAAGFVVWDASWPACGLWARLLRRPLPPSPEQLAAELPIVEGQVGAE